MRAGTLSRFVQNKKGQQQGGGQGGGNAEVSFATVGSLKPRGDLEKYSKDQLVEIGKREVAKLPVLVGQDADPQHGAYIQYSAFWPSETPKGFPQVKHPNQAELQIQLKEDDPEDTKLLNARVVCTAVGLTESIGSLAERLPVGHVMSTARRRRRWRGKYNSITGKNDGDEGFDNNTSNMMIDDDINNNPNNKEGDYSFHDDEEEDDDHDEDDDDYLDEKMDDSFEIESTQYSSNNIEDEMNLLKLRGLSNQNHQLGGFISSVAWENAVNWGEDDEDDDNVLQNRKSDTSGTSIYHSTTTKHAAGGGDGPSTKITLKKTTSETGGNQKRLKVISLKKNSAGGGEESEESDDDLDVDWNAPKKTNQMQGNIKEVVMPTMLTSSEIRAWKEDGDRKSRFIGEKVSRGDLVLHGKLATPMNPNFASGRWLDLVVWDNEPLLEKHVIVSGKQGAPLVIDLNDIGFITRAEVEEAYGIDRRPGGTRTNDADLILKKEETVEMNKLGRKELKKYTKNGRKRKLRDNGYFRFIDDIIARNNEDSKGVADRLRCKRLPDIPKTVVVGPYKPELSHEQARRIHRPRLRVLHEALKVSQPVSNREGGIRQYRQKWNRADLSGAVGAVSLFEYMEERPPLVCNIGMATILCNFYQVDRPTDETFIPPKFDGGGKTVILEPGDKSPFFAILKPNERYMAICNDLVVAPVAEHKVSKTDFLLVKKKPNAATDSDDRSSCYLRNIKSLYLVGQTEPRREVFHPSYTDARTTKKTKMRDFLDIFLDYQITRKFLQAKDPRYVNHKPQLQQVEVLDMFKLINAGLVQKALQRVAAKVKQGVYELKDPDASDAHLREQLPGFNVCQYESLQSGLQRLHDLGVNATAKCDVTRIMHANAILVDFYQIKERVTHALAEAARTGGSKGIVKGKGGAMQGAVNGNRNMHQRVVLPAEAQTELHAAQFIVDELQLSPWYVTTSYHKLRNMEKPRLKLTGLGDPSGRNEGISYLPESIDGLAKKPGGRKRRGGDKQGVLAAISAVEAIKKAEKEEHEAEKEKKKKQEKFGGTDADLRGLTLEDGEKILLYLGHTKQEIDILDRWDRIMLVEEYASAAGGTDNIPVLSKFARNARKLSEKELKERDEVQKKINGLFERQRQALASENPPMFLNAAETEEEKKKRKERKRLKRKAKKRKERERRQKEKEKAEKNNSDIESESETSDSEEDSEPDLPESDSDDSDSSSSDSEDDEMNEDGTPTVGKKKGTGDDDDEDDSEESDDEAANFLQSLKTSLTSSGPGENGVPMGATGGKASNDKALGGDNDDNEEQKALLDLFMKNVTTDKDKTEEMKRKKKEEEERLARVAQERRIPPPPSWANLKKSKLQIVKRTIIEQTPTGETVVKVVFDKTQAEVKRVREEIRKKSEQSVRKLPVDLKTGKGTGRGAKNAKNKREEMSYEEYMRRDRELGLGWAKKIPTPPGVNKRCRTCDLPGHSANSKRCPLRNAPLPKNDNVRLSDGGMKLSIRASVKSNLKKMKAARDPKGEKARGRGGIRNGPLAQLADKLTIVWTMLYRMHEARYFRKKVDRKTLPTYHQFIKNPMFLDKMKKTIEKFSYHSSNDFMDDVKLIHYNSGVFNGAENPITLEAKKLVEAAEKYFLEHRDEITAIEDEIKSLGLTAKPTKRKKTQLFPDAALKRPALGPSSSSASGGPAHFAPPPRLQSQHSISSIDPFSLEAGPSGGTPSAAFYASNISPMPGPSPSPGFFPMPSPSPSELKPSPSPSMTFASPLPQPSPSPGADLMDLDLENNNDLIEEVVEEEEVEEVLD